MNLGRTRWISSCFFFFFVFLLSIGVTVPITSSNHGYTQVLAHNLNSKKTSGAAVG